MTPRARQILAGLNRFLRTPTLSRSVAVLLALALALLLFVNLATFVMIQRTATFNAAVEQSTQTRRAARTLLLSVLDAETGQRGFILTGRPEFLSPYEQALTHTAERLETLQALSAGDPALEPHVTALIAAVRAKLDELGDTIALARAGRIGEAVQRVRSDDGRLLMEDIRRRVAVIDEIKQRRLAIDTRRSERAAHLTVMVNAVAALLILLLAGITAWLVRRYLAELHAARDAVARANAGLEDKVRERTSALSRANDEIQRFAYIVSHDLRAPLVNVMGYTSELDQAGRALERQIAHIEREAPGLMDAEAVTAVREDMPEAIGFIRASTAKMDRLINAILRLSRDGRRRLAPEHLDMTAIVQAIADSVRHQTEAAGAEITVGPLPWIDSDRLSIEQVFGNLIDNAVKYLQPGRAGHIRVEGDNLGGGWVEFRVIDNGRGVGERDHERIFELFRRAGRQDQPGEGLGLAFVRSSARRLGGDVVLESVLGEGSTFRLKFPKRLVPTETGDTA